MDTDSENTPRRLCLGLLAHVDAGKTTLSEALLYESGAIRKLGRVDHRDAFLDTDAMERERGITIFSKQAVFSLADREVALRRNGENPPGAGLRPSGHQRHRRGAGPHPHPLAPSGAVRHPGVSFCQ